jgi:F0F1-type ATP synthase beta subunit
MEVVDTTQINSFLPEQRADFVPHSEEAVFVLTSSQLSDLITQAVEKAIQPLQDEVSLLRVTVERQDEKIAALEARISLQEDNGLIQLRLINDLREATKKGPGKTVVSRADKIERYLSSRPDHRATFETLKGHLGIDKDLLNDAIKTLMDSSPGRYGITRTPEDKRKRTLIMLSK